MSELAPYMTGVIVGTVLTGFHLGDYISSDTTYNLKIADDTLMGFKYDEGDFCNLFETFAKTVEKEVSAGNQRLEIVRNEQTGACTLQGITP